jgi:RNA polymerase sigma-70 factor (ECF subfamily)
VAQEVFLKAFKALRKFKGKSSFSTWLYRITVNACTSEWRKASARKRGREYSLNTPNPDGESAGFDPPGGNDDPSASAEREERARAVHEAIQELEEEFRTVVVLRDIDGFSYEEIADIIDCPLGTVRSRLHRARSDLKEKLKNLL